MSDLGIVRMELYKAHNDRDGNPRECYVGYDRHDNIVATADAGHKGVDAAEWVRAVADRNGEFCPVKNVNVALYEDRVRQGRRLDKARA